MVEDNVLGDRYTSMVVGGVPAGVRTQLENMANTLGRQAVGEVEMISIDVTREDEASVEYSVLTKPYPTPLEEGI